jgi:hypothetical protein
MWRIYYSDGSTYSSEKPIEDAPGDGVLCIVEDDNLVGRSIYSSTDWYWRLDDQWMGGDIDGMKCYLRRPGWKKVIEGEAVPNDVWRDIYNRALTDSDFKRKSAWHRHEKRPKGVELP